MTLDELLKRAEIVSKIVFVLCVILIILVFINTFILN